jgi:hypothetical protein
MKGLCARPLLVGLVLLLVGVPSAVAGSGINGVFNLGVTNSVNAKTTLTGSTASAQLQVTNTNTNAGASGLGVTSASGSATGSFANSSSGIGVSALATTGTAVYAQSGGAAVPALVVKNTAGGPAASFGVSAGAAPFKVSSTTKVSSLNADLLDGLDSTQLQKRVSGTCAAGTAVRVVNADGSVSCQAVIGGGGWTLTGNPGTTPGTNFLGTTDNRDLVIKTNNTEALRVTSSGNVGIGTTSPLTKLEVDSKTRGILGVHAAATGIDPGVDGSTASTDPGAVGVLGRVTSTAAGANSAAVSGINAGTGGNGIGVSGSQAGIGTGVFGSSSGGVGVYGNTGGSGTGLYGNGGSTGGQFISGGNGGNGVIGEDEWAWSATYTPRHLHNGASASVV